MIYWLIGKNTDTMHALPFGTRKVCFCDTKIHYNNRVWIVIWIHLDLFYLHLTQFKCQHMTLPWRYIPLQFYNRGMFVFDTEKATNSSLASEDWALNMEICDMINAAEEGCVHFSCVISLHQLMSLNVKTNLISLQTQRCSQGN